MAREIRTIVTGMHFLEGPRWHDGRVWFSDFYGQQVYSASEDGADLRVEAKVPQQPSGTGWLPDGRLLVVSMRDRKLLRREPDDTLATHADLSAHAGGHLNDMVVDAQGRAWVGDFGFDVMGGAPFQPTGLWRVDPDGSVTRVADDLWFPNGSVITDDGTLRVCETWGNRVSAFDLGGDGMLHNRRSWAEFGPPPTNTDVAAAAGQLAIACDGCCLDAEGALWIADAMGARVVRVSEGGRIIEEIRPGTGTFACMLGGADGRTRFICAAPDFHEAARRQAREAALLAVRVDVPHAGRP